MGHDYSFGTHQDLGVRLDELAPLLRSSFAEYDNVIEPSPDFLHWFTARPGMAPERRFGARSSAGRLASSLFITDTPIWLAGRLLDMAVVDTVMTAPEHRRRGLATRILDRAIADAERRQVDAMLLFTGRDSRPEALYAGRGFTRVAELALMAGRPISGGGVQPCEPIEVLRRAEKEHAGWSGFRSYSQQYEAWRLGGPVARGALSTDAAGLSYAIAPLVGADGVTSCAVVTDTYGFDVSPAVTTAVAGLAPSRVLMCCDATARPVIDGAERAGLRAIGHDVAMVLPLTRAAETCLQTRDCGAWYAMVESIVGV